MYNITLILTLSFNR